MLRRDFIKAISVWAATWPLGVRAQQSERMRRIGVLMAFSENDPEARSWAVGFREELGKLGWAEGRNSGAGVERHRGRRSDGRLGTAARSAGLPGRARFPAPLVCAASVSLFLDVVADIVPDHGDAGF